MLNTNTANADVISFPKQTKHPVKARKSSDLNKNKKGSVVNNKGEILVDFYYLKTRVRERTGLTWNMKNAKYVRGKLDKIMILIESKEFRFAEVFPDSKKAKFFTEKEQKLFGGNITPDQVRFKDYAWTWYNILKDSERIEQRTLWDYKRHLINYLIPFFGDQKFDDLNKSTFDKFISWSKKQKFRGKSISNSTVNKIFVPLKMICKDAAIEYGWGSAFNPFFGFKKLSKEDSYESLKPFSLEEQKLIIASLPKHWKPYFLFAFSAGLRQGEQIGLKYGDINWSEKILQISRAITCDENGKFILGKTKNRYSRRTINLIPVMMNALEMQKEIYSQFNGEFFFCSPNGKRIRSNNLRQRVWIPTLKKAGIEYREMKQTRHSFATNSLSCGENPLWIAKFMGHRNTDMIIKVYSKYIEDATRPKDGNKLDSMYQGMHE